jgi:hypothetical protein
LKTRHNNWLKLTAGVVLQFEFGAPHKNMFKSESTVPRKPAVSFAKSLGGF